MNIRQIKNKLVDVILHKDSIVVDGLERDSWNITNSVVLKFVTIGVSLSGVRFEFCSDWAFEELFVSWETFPAVYQQEIVSCLMANERLDLGVGAAIKDMIDASSAGKAEY